VNSATCHAVDLCPPAPPSCDDENECTMDSFDSSTKTCVHVSRSAVPCDDGDACTSDDECKLGVCEAGPEPDCDDGNVNTKDSCDSTVGCIHTAIPPQPPVQCYGLKFEVGAGVTCVGWPATGTEQWVFKAKSTGWYTAPVGTCSVTCSSVPLACEGEWSGVSDSASHWLTSGCVHLVHDDGSFVDPGCTWDALHCAL